MGNPPDRAITQIDGRSADLQQANDRYRRLLELASGRFYSLGVEPDGSLQALPETDPDLGAGWQVPRGIAPLDAWMKLIHPNDREIAAEQLERLLAGREDTTECRAVTPSGEVRWVRSRARPVLDPVTGRVVRIDGVLEDITEQKKTEQALRESEERYRIVTNLVSDYAYCLRVNDDGSTTREWANTPISTVTGYEEGELAALGGWPAIVFPEDRRISGEFWARLMAGHPASAEYRIRTKSGETRWLQVTAQPVRDEPGVLRIFGATQDVTLRVTTAERFRTAVENLVDAFGIYSAIRDDSGCIVDFRIDFVNEAMSRANLVGREEQVGERLLELFPAHRDAGLFEEYVRVVETGEPLVKESLTYEDTLPSGERLSKSYDFRAVKFGDGYIVSGRDVTERRRTEQALEESEHRFRTAAENLVDAFGIYSAIRDREGRIADFRIEYVNPAACAANQMTFEEQVGKGLLEILPAHKQSGLFNQYCRVVETGEPFVDESRVYEDVYGGGRRLTRAFDVRAAKLGDGLVASWRDITEHQQAVDATERHARQLQVLREIDKTLLAGSSLEDLLPAAVPRIRRLVSADRASVALFDFDADTATVVGVDVDGRTALAADHRLPLSSFGTVPAMRSGELVAVPDLWGAEEPPDPDRTVLLEEGIRSFVRVPLIAEGELIGSLNVGWRATGSLLPEQKELLRDVAAQLALALRQDQLRAEIRTRTARTEALGRMAQALMASGLDTEAQALVGARSAAKIVGDACVISLLSGDGRWLDPVAFHHRRPEAVELMRDLYAATRAGVEEGAWGRVIATGEPLLVPIVTPEDMRASSKAEYRPYLDRFGISSMLFVPLRVQDEVIGTVGFTRDASGRHYTQEDLAVAQTLAADLGLAITNARLFESLRRTDRERRYLLERLVRAQEEERKLIAADIHDDSIQVMTAVGMRLEVLKRELSEPQQLEIVERLAQASEDAISRLRRLLFELRPPAIDRDGLVVALREYIERIADASNLVVGLDDRLDGEPPVETRVIVFRIVQEALANVRKHAQAGRVELTLESRDGGVLARVSDDGVGFSPADVPVEQPGHLGLMSMRERAELSGGWWRIESSPGRGTTVEFWIPATAADPHVA